MSRTLWLASYPKSGNTWFRLLMAKLDLGEETDININAISPFLRNAISSDRRAFEAATLLDTTELTFDEIDGLRPRVDRALQNDAGIAGYDRPVGKSAPGIFLRKVHDAYSRSEDCGEGVGGVIRGGASAAILMVRDPRDVAISLAHHNGSSIDDAIDMMADPDAALSGNRRGAAQQLRQRLLRWDMHCESWMRQADLPVHVLRYEDLLDDTAGRFRQTLAECGVAISEQQADMAATAAAFDRLRDKERTTGFREKPGRSTHFFRSGRAGEWRTRLTPAQAARIVDAHGPMMRELGYPVANEE